MLRFQSDNKVMMEARSEDLRIIWDAMLEGSRFVVDIKDVVTETRVGPTKEFCKGSEDAGNEKNWEGLLKCWEAANVQVSFQLFFVDFGYFIVTILLQPKCRQVFNLSSIILDIS